MSRSSSLPSSKAVDIELCCFIMSPAVLFQGRFIIATDRHLFEARAQPEVVGQRRRRASAKLSIQLASRSLL
jgi:hypothetical protein